MSIREIISLLDLGTILALCLAVFLNTYEIWKIKRRLDRNYFTKLDKDVAPEDDGWNQG